jgi:sulfite exporter TauE/SafE
MNSVGATVEAPSRGLRKFVRRRLETEGASFPELVWVHLLRQKELRSNHHKPYEGPAEERYRTFKERFEAEHGEILNAYWCTDEASGVALTIKSRPLFLPDVVELHWATDWSTKDKPKLMSLLYLCESLSVRVHEVLRDTSQRLAMQSLFTLISFLLAFGESPRAQNDRAVAEIDRTTRDQLKKIEKYYREAAVRSGQIVYVGGMLLGMIPVGLLLVLALVLRLASSPSPARVGLLCFAAGSVGALVSVMSRMTARGVRVDWEFGKDTLRTLGALRPFVGGIFGLMTFFALKSGIVALDVIDGNKSTYFYVLFAFAAGFSERFARDMLLHAPETATGRGKPQAAAQPEQPEPELGDEVDDVLPAITQ